MGFAIRWEDEHGRQLDAAGDPDGLLYKLLDGVTMAEYVWIPTIDVYGDTVFNHLQAQSCFWNGGV